MNFKTNIINTFTNWNEAKDFITGALRLVNNLAKLIPTLKSIYHENLKNWQFSPNDCRYKEQAIKNS